MAETIEGHKEARLFRVASYIQLSCRQLTACFETTGRRVSIQYGSLIKLSANRASTMYNFVKIACNVALIKSNLILDIICPFQQR